MTNYLLDSAETVMPQDAFAKKGFDGRNRTAWDIGAGAGLLGGLVILTGAIFLTVFEYFSGEKSHGDWLFFIVLPILAFGAHCLDKLGAAEKARRIEYCKRHGMKDEDGVKYEYIN